MTTIMITQTCNGHKKGDQINVHDNTARMLIGAGVAKANQPQPPTEEQNERSAQFNSESQAED